MAKGRTVEYVKMMLVDYYDQTKNSDIHQESPSAKALYRDLLGFFSDNDRQNKLFANSDIIAKTEKYYRQHFLDRFEKKDKDWNRKTTTSIIQHSQVQRALQLPPPRPKEQK